MDNKVITMKSPNLILAGFGALERMGEEAANMEARKALMVTDRGVMESGIGERVEAVLKKAGLAVDVWDQVLSDPAIACAEGCIDTAKEGDYDLIVGVGGLMTGVHWIIGRRMKVAAQLDSGAETDLPMASKSGGAGIDSKGNDDEPTDRS